MKKNYFFNDYSLMYKIIFFIILILFIINIIYVYSTKKNKIITIKNSTYFGQSKYGFNLIIDKDNNVYQVKNSIYYLFFNYAELYQQLEINKTYESHLIVTGQHLKKKYGLTVNYIKRDKLKIAKPDAIVMHPGPINRGVEIESKVADGPQSVILKQVSNGIAVRMAVMAMAMQKQGTV